MSYDLTVARKKDSENNSKYGEDPKSHIITGGDPNNPNWEEYIRETKLKYQIYFEVLKEYVVKHYYKTNGQNQDDYYFEFSDGIKFSFTWRGWGDFMQAIINKREGYMAYYM